MRLRGSLALAWLSPLVVALMAVAGSRPRACLPTSEGMWRKAGSNLGFAGVKLEEIIDLVGV
jgi:hypothetical protein